MPRQGSDAGLERIRDLERRLTEAEETLRAIREGKVDAVVVNGPEGPQVYTLRSADHAYRMLVQQMHEGALTLSQSGTIVYANERFSTMTGQPLENIIGHDLTEFVAERCRADVWTLLGTLPSRVEAFLAGAEREVPVSLAASSIFDVTGGRVALVVTDLTEQKARDAAMQAERMARFASEEANRAKDEFLITVSHELRTPLTSILGWATLLNNSDVEESTRRLGIASIERSTRVQAELIDDLLDVSRILTGKIRMTTEPVNIESALATSLATVRAAAEEKHIRLVMSCAADLPAVRGDSTRLQQVFWNLLTNALKFTPEGGRIVVDASADEGWVRIDFHDTGCGVSPEFLPRLFDRFSQEDTSSTRRYTGLGLGLSVARDLVHLHGGTISATSDGIGRGTTFTVLLPAFAADAPAEAAAAPLQVGKSTLDGVTVLAVDDDAGTRAWLAHTLQLFGASVSVAASVAEALTLFEAERPDMIISDLAMPVDDGLSFVARLRVRDDGKSVPAIALTAFGRTEDRERLMAAGFNEYLRKPIDASQLVRTVLDIRRKSAPAVS